MAKKIEKTSDAAADFLRSKAVEVAREMEKRGDTATELASLSRVLVGNVHLAFVLRSSELPADFAGTNAAKLFLLAAAIETIRVHKGPVGYGAKLVETLNAFLDGSMSMVREPDAPLTDEQRVQAISDSFGQLTEGLSIDVVLSALMTIALTVITNIEVSSGKAFDEQDFADKLVARMGEVREAMASQAAQPRPN